MVVQAKPDAGQTVESLTLADIRAAGATLYETICFRKPDLDHFVPLRDIRPQTPQAVEEACLALLGKSERLKIRTMAEALATFQQFKPKRESGKQADSQGAFWHWLRRFAGGK